AALDAYARGVNAWIRTVNENAMGRGAPEFFLFSSEISYWQPADSVAILKLMALQLSGQIEAEVLRARVSLLSSGWAADILPDVTGAPVAELPPYAMLAPGAARSYAALRREPEDPLSPVRRGVFAGASNVWAAAPNRAAAGGSLLANDPHLGFSAPTIWYLARLQLRSGPVIGGTIPGVPAVIAGRNEDLGWGLASSYLDDQDVFMEELNPADPERYRGPDGWVPFTTRKSILKI